jgi:hypothetical protein
MTNEPTIKGLGGMILLSTGLVATVALLGRIMTQNGIQGNAREGTERGKGIPRTDAERRTRHSNLYGEDTELPPCGTGLI